MSRERALKVKAHLRDVFQRQINATPAGCKLAEKMPVELGQFIEHVVGNASMVIDMALDSGELVEKPTGPLCVGNTHYSVAGLDHCQCGQTALTARALGGRPIVYAIPVPGYERVKAGDIELVAVALPPNCSIVVDVNVENGDPPAAPFISIRRQPNGLEIVEVDRG